MLHMNILKGSEKPCSKETYVTLIQSTFPESRVYDFIAWELSD